MGCNKSILFDLDGVLVDACDWHYEALNRALKSVTGYFISREDHETTYNGLPTKVKLRSLVEKGVIPGGSVDDVSNLKQELTLQVIEERCEIDSSKVSLMESLKERGYKVGCVTNSIEKTAKRMLELTGILSFMDCLVTNENIKNAKPHPEGYIKAMVLLNSLPENTTIVEDSDKGLAAAHATGAKVIEVENAKEVTEVLI